MISESTYAVDVHQVADGLTGKLGWVYSVTHEPEGRSVSRGWRMTQAAAEQAAANAMKLDQERRKKQ